MVLGAIPSTDGLWRLLTHRFPLHLDARKVAKDNIYKQSVQRVLDGHEPAWGLCHVFTVDLVRLFALMLDSSPMMDLRLGQRQDQAVGFLGQAEPG